MNSFVPIESISKEIEKAIQTKWQGNDSSNLSLGTAQEIIPGFYLGSMVASQDETFLSNANIKLIINCASKICPSRQRGILYLNLPLDDSPEVKFAELDMHILKILNAIENPISLEKQKELQHFPAASFTSLLEDEKQKRPGILIHCYAGISRSATMMIALFLILSKLKLDEVYSFISSKRKIAPNPTFYQWLRTIDNGKRKFMVES